jgi:hypothetical protein
MTNMSDTLKNSEVGSPKDLTKLKNWKIYHRMNISKFSESTMKVGKSFDASNKGKHLFTLQGRRKV